MVGESYAAAAVPWWRRCWLVAQRGMQAMSDGVRLPDGKGFVIPVAILLALCGVFVRAGRILERQEELDTKLVEFQADMKRVDELRGKVDAVTTSQDAFQTGWAAFVRTSLSSQEEFRENVKALNRRLDDQATRHNLLDDYTRGRVGDLPYRAPDSRVREKGPDP